MHIKEGKKMIFNENIYTEEQLRPRRTSTWHMAINTWHAHHSIKGFHCF